MGWRDRDWAKFTDGEWEAIYGRRRDPSRRDRPTSRVRPYLYGMVGLAVLVVAAFALHPTNQLLAQSVDPSTRSGVLYGIRGHGPDTESPGGANTVCTEIAIAQSSMRWQCLTWEINIHHVPVVNPRRYDGACGHLVVDPARSAWTCLSATPLPDHELPSRPFGDVGSPPA